MRVPDAFDMDDAAELGDQDDIVCKRCGAAGLYWQSVTQADGRGERYALFDGRSKRPHRCETGPISIDAFGAVE
jgi:hypothetical protein